jgi:glycosyltransferase involved in cell wall biosynthesis
LKRVLIVDSSPDGHHPFYDRLLLDSGLADVADIVFAASRDMFNHPVIKACAERFRSHEIELAQPPPGASASTGVMRRSWSFGRLYRKAFLEVARSAPVDFVIVPYLDDCLLGLAAPREAFWGTPWLAITMRTMFHYRDMGVNAPEQSFAAIRRLLACRILKQRGTAALLTIDPTLAEFADRQPDPMMRKIRYVPDPANRHAALPPRDAARGRLDIPADARVVLLYGAISERKGASLLVQAAAAAACASQVHLLMAGSFRGLDELQRSDGWQSLLAQRRIHAFDGFVDDEREQLILASADCMWVGYIDFYGVSSVMALAGIHAMPVLASDYGLVGHFTRKHQLGAILDPRDPSSIVAALNRLVSEPEFFRRAGSNGVTVYQGHSPSELQQAVTDTVQRSWAPAPCYS